MYATDEHQPGIRRRRHFTATSAFRISFSRTISDRPFDRLFGRGRRSDLDPHHVSHASTASFIQRYDDPEMVGIEPLTIQPLGENDLLRLEFGRYFSEGQHRAIAVSTENHDRLGNLVSARCKVRPFPAPSTITAPRKTPHVGRVR